MIAEIQQTTSNDMLITFSGALFLGVAFVILAHKMRISAIVVLLIGGILVGPEGFGLIDPSHLGDGLKTIISLAVGIILFEGGLNLDIKGYKQASVEIKGVLTRGIIITWGLSTLAVWTIFRFDFLFCLLLGSMVIVTGPTVIGPLLKRIQVRKKIHHILHWEGVLIDPAGVFISLLCYQLTVGDTIHAWQDFLSRGFWGGLMGVIGGIILSQLMKRKWIPEESRNIAVLAFAIAIFSVSDLVAHESGLLSVTIAGLLLGYMDIPEIKKLKVYKAELTELLIGLLFVLLAASLDLSKFIDMGWKGVVIVLIIMFIVRPINIFVSTFGSKLSLNEKLFLSWIAPRGIVAASMASLFSLNLAEQWAGDPAKIAQAELLEAYTYAVIAGTVIFQGFTAKLVGKALGVLEPQPSGWLIIGAHKLGRQLANFISKRGKHVVLIDSNVRNIALAKRNGLTALNENALKMDMEDYPELYGIGNILAITENSDLNILICQRFHGESAGLYRWESAVTADGHEEDEDHHGLPVWNLIDAAMMKALDFEEDNSLKIQSVNLATVKHTERVLLYCKDGDITPRIAEQDGECEIISYNPVHVEMGISTKEEWILITDSTNLNDLFDTMLGKLLGYFPDLDSKMIQDRLLKQEQDYSSLIGYGVALPHFYVDGLSESVVMIAKLETPLKDLHSKEEIHFIFLVLSPSDQPKNHLQALSEISSFIMVEERRQDMFLAKTTEELIAVFFPGR